MADYSSLNGISSAAYTDYSAATQYSDKVKNAVDSTSSASTDDELMDACKQFEAYFLEQVFKEMEKSVDAFKDEDSEMSNSLSMTSSNSLVDYYKDLTTQTIASTTADKQSTGLAQMLYENMKRTYGIGESGTASSDTSSETASNNTSAVSNV